jgi:hypothetical protein
MKKALSFVIISIGTWLAGFAIGAFITTINAIPLLILAVGILIIYLGIVFHYKALNTNFSILRQLPPKGLGMSYVALRECIAIERSINPDAVRMEKERIKDDEVYAFL